MWQKLLLIILLICMILPSALAKENISIGEIGAEQGQLIEGINTKLFANITNNENTSVEMVLEFWIDSRIVSRQKAISKPLTDYRIISDNSSVISLENKQIEVILYVHDTRIDNKSIPLKIEERTSISGPQTNTLLTFNNLLIAVAVIIIILFIVILYIKYNFNQDDNPVEAQIPYKPLVTAKSPINDFSEYLNEIKNNTNKNMQGEEYKLLINIFENIHNMMQNLKGNNVEIAEINFQQVREASNNLISRFEKIETKSFSPAKHESPQKSVEEKIEKIERLLNELRPKLEQQKIEVNNKKQFVDVLILEFLMEMAEDRINKNDIKEASSLILANEFLLNDDRIMQRLRKLREIGF